MGYRNIKIDSSVDVRIRNYQLLINDYSIPLEDMNSILIENPTVKLSEYFLRTCADEGIAVYVCDEKHMPNGVLLPLEKHCRHFKELRTQIEAPKPLKKRIWQEIVICKVANQAECIRLSGKEGCKQLLQMSKAVQSGDRTLVEAKAAEFYFHQLFGQDFVRREENALNGALNYGYAIIRGNIARTIVVHGLEPSLGINHHSELNSFNLADDFIECFRPLVDLLVFSMKDDILSEEELTPEIKRKLFSVLTLDMEINHQKQIINNCVDILTESYIRSLEEGEQMLLTPKLLKLGIHQYE